MSEGDLIFNNPWFQDKAQYFSKIGKKFYTHTGLKTLGVKAGYREYATPAFTMQR